MGMYRELKIETGSKPITRSFQVHKIAMLSEWIVKRDIEIERGRGAKQTKIHYLPKFSMPIHHVYLYLWKIVEKGNWVGGGNHSSIIFELIIHSSKYMIGSSSLMSQFPLHQTEMWRKNNHHKIITRETNTTTTKSSLVTVTRSSQNHHLWQWQDHHKIIV